MVYVVMITVALFVGACLIRMVLRDDMKKQDGSRGNGGKK